MTERELRYRSHLRRFAPRRAFTLASVVSRSSVFLVAKYGEMLQPGH